MALNHVLPGLRTQVWVVGQPKIKGHTYYAHPSGNGVGTIGDPASLAGGIALLHPGDTLLLRGGTYNLNGLVIGGLKGKRNGRITIANFPAETPILSGAIPNFPSNEWDNTGQSPSTVYKSKHAYVNPTSSNKAYGAWMGNKDVQLIQYAYEANLRSASDVYQMSGSPARTAATYTNPGIWVDGSNFWYMRITQNSDVTGNDDDGFPLTFPFSGSDPNSEGIVPFYVKNLVYLQQCAYLDIVGIKSQDAVNCWVLQNGNDHIAFTSCNMRLGTRGIYADSGEQADKYATNITVDGCDLTNGHPNYMFWTDVKDAIKDTNGNDAKEAYPEFQNYCIAGLYTNITINKSKFHDTMDGCLFDEPSTGIKIYRSKFWNVYDDCVNLYPSNSGEIAYNFMRGMSCISGQSQNPGVYPLATVKIHHNILDTSRHLLRTRTGDTFTGFSRWDNGSPIGNHGSETEKRQGWHIYNNHIITRYGPGSVASQNGVTGNFNANDNAYFKDNIIWSRDGNSLMARYHNIVDAPGMKYDGNIWHRMGTPSGNMFQDFGVTQTSDFTDLASLQAAMAAVDPSLRWETNGIDIDPQFDITQIIAPLTASNIDVVWRRYLAANASVYTAGVQAAYRGALPTPLLLDVTTSEASAFDLWFDEANPTTNHATDTIISIRSQTANRRYGIIKLDLSSIPAGSIVAYATIYMYSSTANPSADRTFAFYPLAAANITGLSESATWNKKDGSSLNWAGDTGGDGGTDAGGSVSGTDFQATASFTLTWTNADAANTLKTATINPDDVQANIGSSLYLIGRRTSDTVSSIFNIHSSNAVDATKHWRYVVAYWTPSMLGF